MPSSSATSALALHICESGLPHALSLRHRTHVHTPTHSHTHVRGSAPSTHSNERIKRLKRVWWQQSTLPEDLKRNMSVQEKDFYAKYGETMEGYMEQIGIFDLTTDAKPPTNLMVQVRILEHHGEVMLRSGQTVNLTPSSIRMLTSDVEGLIADGIKVEVQNQS